MKEEKSIEPGVVEGAGRTVYRHPSGFTCTWTFQLRLKK
jgi:hypothetical protein